MHYIYTHISRLKLTSSFNAENVLSSRKWETHENKIHILSEVQLWMISNIHFNIRKLLYIFYYYFYIHFYYYIGFVFSLISLNYSFSFGLNLVSVSKYHFYSRNQRTQYSTKFLPCVETLTTSVRQKKWIF